MCNILTALQPYKRTATISVQFKPMLPSGNQSETAFKKKKVIVLQLGSKCALIFFISFLYKNSSIKYAGVCVEEYNVEVFVNIFVF